MPTRANVRAISLIVLLTACRSDQITWNDEQTRGEVGVIVTGNCLGRPPMRSRPFKTVKSPIRPGRLIRYSGPSSVFGFAHGRQPAHRTVVWKWCEDKPRLSFAKAITLPIKFHVTRGDFATMESKILEAFATVNALFRKERLGIRLKLVEPIEDHTADPACADSIYDEISCGDIPTSEAATDPLFPVHQADLAKDALHVWYVGSVVDWKASTGTTSSNEAAGVYCRESGWRTILIGIKASPELLAHEIGHTFCGRHTDSHVDITSSVFRAGFDATNIMTSRGSAARAYFTEGQVLRAHYADYSLLNTPDWLGSTGSSLRKERHVIDDMKAWYSNKDGGSPSVGEYPPACWRIWDDGDLKANTGADSIDDNCLKPEGESDSTGPSGLTPLGLVPEPPNDSISAAEYARVLTAMGMLFTDCRNGEAPDVKAVLDPTTPAIVQVFSGYAVNGPEDRQRKWARARGDEKRVLLNTWLGSSESRDLMPAKSTALLLDRAHDTVLSGYETRFVEKFRIAAIDALGILNTPASREVLGRLAGEDDRIGRAARIALQPD